MPFQHDMAYGDFKDLPGRTASDKVCNIAKNPKYGYQRGLASLGYKCFDKKSSGGAVKCANKSLKVKSCHTNN